MFSSNTTFVLLFSCFKNLINTTAMQRYVIIKSKIRIINKIELNVKIKIMILNNIIIKSNIYLFPNYLNNIFISLTYYIIKLYNNFSNL